MNTNTSTFEVAGRLLAEAGITSTPVAECDGEGCPWCRPEQLSRAA
jgi:hypothetical protein